MTKVSRSSQLLQVPPPLAQIKAPCPPHVCRPELRNFNERVLAGVVPVLFGHCLPGGGDPERGRRGGCCQVRLLPRPGETTSTSLGDKQGEEEGAWSFFLTTGWHVCFVSPLIYPVFSFLSPILVTHPSLSLVADTDTAMFLASATPP